MPIRSLVAGTPESIALYENAAAVKIEAGFTLMADGFHGDGVYLMGYAAEMYLKSACLRQYGFGVNQPVTIANLKQIRQDAVANLGVLNPSQEALHDIVLWAETLIQKRIVLGRSLPAGLAADLRRSAATLVSNRWVGMRYHDIGAVNFSDLTDVFDQVMWIQENYQNLWS